MAETGTDIQFTAGGEGESITFEVTVTGGPDRGRAVRIDASLPNRVLVGQSTAADLPLTDRLVSRRHLALEVKSGGLFIEDLGSTNGTVLGGVRILQAYARGGETIAIGATSLLVTTAAPTHVDIPLARGFGRIVGSSLAMRRLYPLLERLAASDANLLLEGETGTGKELVTETLHQHGPRRGGPFVVIDCASLDDATGATVLLGDASRPGLVEAAHGGTLVLDEIGELPAALQPLLLRAIERGEVQRPGEPRIRRVSVRVIATTRLDLDKLIADGAFRADLFYRLATTRLELPPLRHREGDVGILARHFWDVLGGDAASLPYEALELLEHQEFRGNVRELMGAVTRLVTLGNVDGLPEPTGAASTLDAFCLTDVPYARAKEQLLSAFERRYVKRMVEHHGSVAGAAAASGLALRYFQLLRARHAREG